MINLTEDLHDRIINGMTVVIVAIVFGYSYVPKHWQWIPLTIVCLCALTMVVVYFALRWNDDFGEGCECDEGEDHHDITD